MFERESVPFAPALVESMRALGYSFESAVADIIDNSITAGAKNINIYMLQMDKPLFYIVDDGCGMTALELEEAMRYGCINPSLERAENDLGRFGLGLKSASLSQCRELVVVSKKNNELSAFSWNLDYVEKTGKWTLIGLEKHEIQSLEAANSLNGKSSGTVVIWKNFDRVKTSTADIVQTLTKKLSSAIDHLALVFHRYLMDGLQISVNNEPITARDPFLENSQLTQRKREQSFYIDGQEIKVKPFILPHPSQLRKKDIAALGGKDSLRTEQGFYIYRNRRLIIWGTWFRLERKEELSKLARVRVDIPNTLDYMWSIDIKKSSAQLPDIIKQNLYSCIDISTGGSENVHTYRGRKTNQIKGIEYVWERIALRDGFCYKINRNLPILKIFQEQLTEQQIKLLEQYTSLIERSFPSSTLYIDASKDKLVEEVSDDTAKMYNDILNQLESAENTGLNIAALITTFITCEPYCNDSDLVNKLIEKRKEYE